MADWAADELAPGPEAQSDDEIIDYDGLKVFIDSMSLPGSAMWETAPVLNATLP